MFIASSDNDKPMLMRQKCKQGFAYNSDFIMTSIITQKEMEASAILRPETHHGNFASVLVSSVVRRGCYGSE